MVVVQASLHLVMGHWRTCIYTLMVMSSCMNHHHFEPQSIIIITPSCHACYIKCKAYARSNGTWHFWTSFKSYAIHTVGIYYYLSRDGAQHLLHTSLTGPMCKPPISPYHRSEGSMSSLAAIGLYFLFPRQRSCQALGSGGHQMHLEIVIPMWHHMAHLIAS